MKILVVGGNGMLGHRLLHELSSRQAWTLAATVRHPLPEAFAPQGVAFHDGVDLRDGGERVREVIATTRPNLVINAAGLVKQKEEGSNPRLSFDINGMIPHLLAVACEQVQARLIHISTDCVFKGDAGPYTQDAARDAVDVYGRAKAVGEVWYPPHLTLRTSIVGFEVSSRHGLVNWLFSQPCGAEVPGWSRAFFSGVTTGELARTLLRILETVPDLSGLWHLASEATDKASLLERLNRRFSLGLTVRPDNRVEINRSLDDAPLRALLDTARPSWDFLVEDLAADWVRLPYRSLFPERQ